MSIETARRAVEIAMTAPAKNIKLEFQGGEPLLNFDLIRAIVPFAKELAAASAKSLQFVITTNLALLDDAILSFCKENSVLLSTSLDGPADLHNKNRPRNGNNSYELAVSGIKKSQAYLGVDQVGALMTTTDASLTRVEEIVDEYISLGLSGIFLRPLSPYGFAVKTKHYQRYDITNWLSFYERGLRYIIRLNQFGRRFSEFYTAMILQRMLTDRPTGYVDLRSPAGSGLGAIVYNYDGEVYASDEARMLAEMGDKKFVIGHVDTDDLQSMLLKDDFVSMIATSMTQAVPQCNSCAYEPYCGSDPIFHHATEGDIVGIKPLSQFCARQKGVIGLLVDILNEDGPDAETLRSWLH